MVITAGVLGLLGFIVYTARQLTAGFFVYAVLASVVLLGIVWVASAIANAYLWSYWTVAYLRLSGQLAASAIVQT